MRNLNGKSYTEKPYVTGTSQKRRREAHDKLMERRLSRRQAKNKRSNDGQG